ncbi:MAG TPA: single-stranded DNA-binding protein [Acidimicrobiia bacterium]|nr:single-stranded DNA-binding protein [Acidimicrobiia bacterium]
MADNTITVIGNITRDPEIRYTPTGQANANFGVAVNRRWMNRQTQEWEERTSFFNVVCWREMAENVGESLAKGSRVVVTGRLEQRSWETEQGERRSVVEIVADDIGPSLRWATAKVEKIDRRGGSDFGGGPTSGSGGGPTSGSGGAPAGDGGGGSQSGGSQPGGSGGSGGGYDEFGEEPF